MVHTHYPSRERGHPCGDLNVVLDLERSWAVRYFNIAGVWVTVVVTPRVIIIKSVTYWFGRLWSAKDSYKALIRFPRDLAWFSNPELVYRWEEVVAAGCKSSGPPGQSSAQPVNISRSKQVSYSIHYRKCIIAWKRTKSQIPHIRMIQVSCKLRPCHLTWVTEMQL